MNDLGLAGILAGVIVAAMAAMGYVLKRSINALTELTETLSKKARDQADHIALNQPTACNAPQDVQQIHEQLFREIGTSLGQMDGKLTMILANGSGKGGPHVA